MQWGLQENGVLPDQLEELVFQGVLGHKALSDRQERREIRVKKDLLE